MPALVQIAPNEWRNTVKPLAIPSTCLPGQRFLEVVVCLLTRQRVETGPLDLRRGIAEAGAVIVYWPPGVLREPNPASPSAVSACIGTSRVYVAMSLRRLRSLIVTHTVVKLEVVDLRATDFAAPARPRNAAMAIMG